MSNKTPRPSIFAYVAVTVFTLLPILIVMEIYLRAADPWGIKFFGDVILMEKVYVPDAIRGFVLPTGRYTFHDWSAAIGEDNTRLVSGTIPDVDCTLVMIGDSHTFGHGVNDGETWVDVLAAHFQDVHFINAGMSQYNYPNVLGQVAAFPNANGYVYLIIDNDVQETFGPPEIEGRPLYRQPKVGQYLWYFLQSYLANNQKAFEADPTPFLDALDGLTASHEVLLLGYGRGYGLAYLVAESGFDVNFITPYSETVSLADNHPSAASHQQIGTELIPVVEGFKARVCLNS